MYIIQRGYYEKSATLVAIAKTYEQAERIAESEMQAIDPFHTWSHAYPESLEVTHYHIALKPGFPFVYILTIPSAL